MYKFKEITYCTSFVCMLSCRLTTGGCCGNSPWCSPVSYSAGGGDSGGDIEMQEGITVSVPVGEVEKNQSRY